MPTYEYVCKDCGYEFEAFQSIKAEPIKVCPKCGGHNVVRKISAGAGLVFKGSGFYITDYKNKHSSPSNGNGNGNHAKSSAKESTAKEKE
ncbi:MAG TPA: zinc ribbon domain-containing protein [Caldithrix abyssi]|uniref:Zinc ribbon domain-containing protein n=1 Tax=Caldithrix abyssi TaxID=187145 RepID=A0A7V5UFK0_CALAY|nr:zinc ribbon domain-containing protein [Caldithrix abyssi]